MSELITPTENTKKKFNTQVEEGHYLASYDTLERFIGYFYQIDFIRKLKPKTILEIGIGNRTTSNYVNKRIIVSGYPQ